MDKELKTKKLASANVRKQRIAERAIHKTVLAEQREERKKRFQRYSEIYASESDNSRASSPERATPSEIEIRTPLSSPEEVIKIQFDFEDHDASDPTLLAKQLSKPTNPSMFKASLNTANDWKYDRFSIFIKEKPEGIESSDESSQEEDEPSPIEVATPISYHTPTCRPAVVSVTLSAISLPARGPAKFSAANISDIMIAPKSRTTESLARLKENNNSGFLASEARPFEVNTPSNRSVISIETLSTQSLPAEETETQVKKKSSVPMLTKFTHARMSSIKSFIKPASISGPPPAIPQVPQAHQSRPSESANDILFGKSHQHQSTSQSVVPRRSLSESQQMRDQPVQRPQTARMSKMSFSSIAHSTVSNPFPEQRPQTARMSKMSIQSIAQSTVSNDLQRTPSTIELSEEPTLNKKKSFTNLRRRSGSLGQALKFATSGKKPATPDQPLPPMPITIPVQERAERNSTMLQPPKTPRSMRKSGMGYSPFPTTNRAQPVGPGLRI